LERLQAELAAERGEPIAASDADSDGDGFDSYDDEDAGDDEDNEE
jgi:hypothetical protein